LTVFTPIIWNTLDLENSNLIKSPTIGIKGWRIGLKPKEFQVVFLKRGSILSGSMGAISAPLYKEVWAAPSALKRL